MKYREIMKRPMRLSQRILEKYSWLFGALIKRPSKGAVMARENRSSWGGLITEKGFALLFYNFSDDRQWIAYEDAFVKDYEDAIEQFPMLANYRFYDAMDAPFPENRGYIEVDEIKEEHYEQDKALQSRHIRRLLKQSGVCVDEGVDDEGRHVVEALDESVGRRITVVDQDLCEAFETVKCALDITDV